MIKGTGAAVAKKVAWKHLSTAALMRRIEQGLPFSALESLATRSGLDLNVIAAVIGLPERAMGKRKAARRLSAAESERLVRLDRIFECASKLFEGDSEAAMAWLARPRREFQSESALAYLRYEVGGREVEDLIGRLEHGVFS